MNFVFNWSVATETNMLNMYIDGSPISMSDLG